jgi:DNA-binding transcriptional LysR family regulator
VSGSTDPRGPADWASGTANLWPGLQIRHLAALSALAQEGSFGRAAQRLGYTQSAISQQIAALERTVGQQLVDRPGGTRPVTLTPAGALLEEHASTILSRLAAARADLAVLPREGPTTLEVGVYQSVGARIIPGALSRFRRAWPHTTVQLTESNRDQELLALLEHGRLDIAFAVLPLGEGPFEWVELLRDPYVLIVPADSPLARRPTPPTAAELTALQLIGFRECRSVDAAEEQLLARGVVPRIIFRSNDNRTIQALVAAGVGAALMPQLAFEPHDDAVVAVPLDLDLPPRILALAWHRDRHLGPQLEAFAEIVRESCLGVAAGV